jgi:hypothetical protein
MEVPGAVGQPILDEGTSLRVGGDCLRRGIAERMLQVSPENCKRVQAAVKVAGDELKGKLPARLEHPERNAYAHAWRAIKQKFGKTYKECDDADLDAMLALIEHVRLHPE